MVYRNFLLALSCCVLLSSLLSSTAVAQTPPTEPVQQTERDRTIRTIRPQTQARITNLAANVSNRLEAYINRLQNIATRLNSRLDKLTADGYDVSIARASLGRAQTAIDAARTELTGIDEKVAAVTGGNEPLEAWREVRVSFLTARDSIRVAFDELRTVMIDIRGALAAGTTTPVATTTEITN